MRLRQGLLEGEEIDVGQFGQVRRLQVAVRYIVPGLPRYNAGVGRFVCPD